MKPKNEYWIEPWADAEGLRFFCVFENGECLCESVHRLTAKIRDREMKAFAKATGLSIRRAKP